jgi:hypothetical protein
MISDGTSPGPLTRPKLPASADNSTASTMAAVDVGGNWQLAMRKGEIRL